MLQSLKNPQSHFNDLQLTIDNLPSLPEEYYFRDYKITSPGKDYIIYDQWFYTNDDIPYAKLICHFSDYLCISSSSLHKTVTKIETNMMDLVNQGNRDLF